MKLKVFTLISCILFCLNSYSQNNSLWLDVDFSSEEWLDAFEEALGTDIRTASGDPATIGLADGTVVKDFVFNGNLLKEPSGFTSVSGKSFQYAIRLRNNSATYIELPELENAGKIYVYVRNENESVESVLNLQYKNAEGSWTSANSLVRWIVPGYLNYEEEAYDMELSYEINSESPVKLRLHRNEARFMRIYAIKVEKYDAGGSVSVPSTFDKDIHLTVNNKTLLLSQTIDNANLVVYDFSDRQVFNRNINSHKVDLNDLNGGVYIVKIVAEQRELSQKIVLK